MGPNHELMLCTVRVRPTGCAWTEPDEPGLCRTGEYLSRIPTIQSRQDGYPSLVS